MYCLIAAGVTSARQTSAASRLTTVEALAVSV
jgi:hypothetical protein